MDDDGDILDIFAGTMVILGCNDKEEFCSLTDEQVVFLLAEFGEPETPDDWLIDDIDLTREDLTKTGVYRYAEDPAFEILLFGVSVDDGPITVYDLSAEEEIPEEILIALQNPEVTKWAFNAMFERVCLSRYLYFNALASGLFGLHYSSGVEDDGSTIRYAHTSERLQDSAWAWKSGIRGFFVSTDGGQTWRLGWDTSDKVAKTAVEAVGVNANIFGSGTLRTALVKILGTEKFYWDADSIVMVAPNDSTKLIKIGQYRTGDYGIAVSTDNGATWTTIIDFDGLHGGDDGGGGSGEQTIIYQDAIVKSPTAPTNPSLHDLWIDTILLRLRMWNGEEWVNIGYEPETPDPDEPVDPDPGDDPGGEEPGGDDPGGGEDGSTGGDDPGSDPSDPGGDGGGDEEENPGDETPEEGGSKCRSISARYPFIRILSFP